MANPAADLTTSDIIVETLIAWGATDVFGLVGDGIAGLIEAVQARGSNPVCWRTPRRTAAFMASGYAKLTGNAMKFDRRSCRLEAVPSENPPLRFVARFLLRQLEPRINIRGFLNQADPLTLCPVLPTFEEAHL